MAKKLSWSLLTLGFFLCGISFSDPLPPALPETLKDVSFSCVAPQGPTLVEADFNICMYFVTCSSKTEKARRYMPKCRVKDGKCPSFGDCATPTGARADRVVEKDAKVAEAAADDRKETDRYGRSCNYLITKPKSIFINTPDGPKGFCGTPIVCVGGEADAPDLAYAACEPSESVKEEGKALPAHTCPRVNSCINRPLRIGRGEVGDIMGILKKRARQLGGPDEQLARGAERRPIGRGATAPGHF